MVLKGRSGHPYPPRRRPKPARNGDARRLPASGQTGRRQDYHRAGPETRPPVTPTRFDTTVAGESKAANNKSSGYDPGGRGNSSSPVSSDAGREGTRPPPRRARDGGRLPPLPLDAVRNHRTHVVEAGESPATIRRRYGMGDHTNCCALRTDHRSPKLRVRQERKRWRELEGAANSTAGPRPARLPPRRSPVHVGRAPSASFP